MLKIGFYINFCYNVYIEEIVMKFNDLKNKLKILFFDEEVKKMLFYGLVNRSFYDFLSDLNFDDVESFLNLVYQKELDIIEKLKNEKDEFSKYEFSIELEHYFALIELFTEKSVFSNNLIVDFKNAFGKKYLSVFESIDNNEIIDIDPILLHNYSIIKSWQDKQNQLGRLVIEDLLSDVNYFYQDEKEYLFFKLREKKILDMDILSNFFDVLDKKDILSLVGGKCYGLIKLYKYGINIPLTYAVLTDTNLTLEDIDFLDKDIKYSVRSSATIEDGDKYSFAGMFDTFLNVSYEEIIDKVKLVKDSVNSQHVKKYIDENNLCNANMAIVIQEFADVSFSGIWIGINENEGVLEYINDIGEKLVSGSVSANRIKIKKGDSYFVDSVNIGEVFVNIQNMFHEICDLEWCIIDNKLFLLQYRAVTKGIDLFVCDEKVSLNSDEVRGLGVSSGEIEGNISYLESIDDFAHLEKNTILLTTKTDVSWMRVLNNVKGLITYKGSLLCHAAIIAREMGIACVTDLSKEDYERLKSVNKVRINGSSGVIKIIE